MDRTTSKRQTLREMSSEQLTSQSLKKTSLIGPAADSPAQSEPQEDAEKPNPFNLPLKVVRGKEVPYDSKKLFFLSFGRTSSM